MNPNCEPLQKRCFKCERLLPLSEFYRHPQMADGHLGKCKDCAKQDTRENRAKRREYYSRYDQERYRKPERRKMSAEQAKLHRVKHPKRCKARQKLQNAVRDGRIQKQPCVFCGNENSQAHHHDYSKPLEVTWVCFKCHREQFHGQTVVVDD